MRRYITQGINRALGLVNLRATRRGIGLRLTEEHAELRARNARSIHEIQGYYRSFIDCDYQEEANRNVLLADLKGTEISEALHIVTALRTTRGLAGDVCEFGVAQGATSALICNEVKDSHQTVWLFDSFKGLSAPTEKDVLLDDISNFGTIDKYAGSMASPLWMLKSRISKVGIPPSRVRIVRGFIEDTISGSHLPSAIAFAYVDFDFYEPIKVTLDFLHKNLVPGGVVIVDDYGFFSAGAKTAVDEFLATHGDRYKCALYTSYLGHFAVISRSASEDVVGA